MPVKKVAIAATKPVEPKNTELIPVAMLTGITDLVSKSQQIKVITTDAQLRSADMIDGMLADTIKGVQAELKEMKDDAYKLHKKITKYETDKTNPLIIERKRLSGLVSTCLMERRRLADEEARKQTIENARLAREEAERNRETRIEVLVAEGKDDEVAELMDTELVVENTSAVRVESVAPAGLGMHAVQRWVGEVHNLKMLIDAVASGKLPMGTVENPGPVMVNQRYLDKIAGIEKSTMMYPGVTAKDVGGTSR